jgi:hypothetical protein
MGPPPTWSAVDGETDANYLIGARPLFFLFIGCAAERHPGDLPRIASLRPASFPGLRED